MRRYVLAILLLVSFAPAQDGPLLRRLARDAGLIFSGTVESIEPAAPASRGDIGVVRITFRVVDALRGATPGQALTIAEWDGLWTAGDRYRVGETLLVFFYPPSGDLGLTTTVAGDQGRISLAASPLSIASVAQQIADDTTTLPVKKPRPRRQPRSRARARSME